MLSFQGVFGTASIFVLISAALHFVAGVLVGLDAGGASLMIVGVVYGFAALGLQRGLRWLAHLVFLAMLMGIVTAIGGVFDLAGLASWVFIGIVIANILAVAALFVRLWKAAPAKANPNL